VPVMPSSPHKSTFYQSNIKNIAALALKFLDAGLICRKYEEIQNENEYATPFGN
jgi:hypothetical protein